MKIYELTSELVVAKPIETVFAFFARPENLQWITPPWVRFAIVTPRPIPMHPGSVIDYTLRIRKVPARWTTVITDYDPPHGFVDLQLRGPYAYWHHTHTFVAEGNNTIVRDHVRYAMPFGPLGRLVHSFMVRNDVQKIFDYRAQAIARHFLDDTGGGGAQPGSPALRATAS